MLGKEEIVSPALDELKEHYQRIIEFQEFFRVNKSVFSDMQRIWDLYSPKSHINLIVCGSIYSMMTKIFKDKKEPLYNRQSRFMTVRPFTPTVLKDILSEYNPGYTAEDLLALYEVVISGIETIPSRRESHRSSKLLISKPVSSGL